MKERKSTHKTMKEYVEINFSDPTVRKYQRTMTLSGDRYFSKYISCSTNTIQNVNKTQEGCQSLPAEEKH